jgi:Flp pilus assembly protein TadG
MRNRLVDLSHRLVATRVREGQAIVEFALCFFVYILIVGVAVEGGRLIYSYVTLSHAAHDGARTAVLAGKTSTQVRDRVVASAAPLTVASEDILMSPNFATRAMGDRITVSVSYTYTPIISMIIGEGSFTLSGSSEMMAE